MVSGKLLRRWQSLFEFGFLMPIGRRRQNNFIDVVNLVRHWIVGVKLRNFVIFSCKITSQVTGSNAHIVEDRHGAGFGQIEGLLRQLNHPAEVVAGV